MSAPSNEAGPDWDPPLLEEDRAGPTMPVLLTGHRAAAILSGGSDLALEWEARGARMEWGGVYAQGIRLTGPWTLQLGERGKALLSLEQSLRKLTVRRTGLVSLHTGPGWSARQEVVVPHDDPAVTRRLSITALAERGLKLRVGMSVEPFLLPVLMEGLKPHSYSLRSTPTGFAVSAEGSAFELVSSTGPTSAHYGGTSLPAEPKSVPPGHIELTWDLTMDPAERLDLSWVIWGGGERLVRQEPDHGQRILGCRESWAMDRRQSQADWWAERPRLRFPQAPELERAAVLATGALEGLMQAPEPGMVGLVAGYPWYCALWFRDIAWMLPAALWLGDFDWARATLGTAFRFQSRAHLPVIAAEIGEVPMQVSPGPIFLYGTSDTTLHFPALAHRFVRHAGAERGSFLRPLLPQVGACVEWADRKLSPRTGLFTNGGEIAEMAQATQGGKVQYGFDAKDTTIWDSTDRRSHAIDLQVLHARALKGSAALGAMFGQPGPNDGERRALEVQQKVVERYDWPQQSYLVDTLDAEGRPVPRLRPNALISVSDGWFPRAKAQAIVQRAARPDLTTPWGVRTLSEADPGFDPEAYHDGQVWTIATDWAAQAAFRAGLPEVGLSYLRTVSKLLASERGLANECYHGSRPEPFDSCFLLGLSVGPFLTALFEGLWGLSIPVPGTLVLDPQMPQGWKQAGMEHLRLGASRLDLQWSPGKVAVHVRDGPEVHVGARSADEMVVVPSGSTRSIALPEAPSS